GPIVLGIAVFTQRLAALAVKGEAGSVNEDGGEVGEQVAAAVEQPLLDQVLEAARRQRPIRLLLEFLAEPGHGAVEVMQIEPLGAGDIVILDPRGAVAVGSRNEQPMQGGDEDGALDRKLECALLQQADQDVGDAEPLPDSAKQQGSADPLGGDRQRALGIFVERIDQQHLIGELGARGNERSERAGGGQLVGAAEIGDHPLAPGAPAPPVLDNLHVAALAGPLEAEEHGPSLSSTTESDSKPNIKRKNRANVALHFEKTAHRPQ